MAKDDMCIQGRLIPTIGSSNLLQWSGVAVLLEIFWSERSACAALGCWHKCRWPLFLVFYFTLVLVVVKIPEGVVVGFQIFAWAPN